MVGYLSSLASRDLSAWAGVCWVFNSPASFGIERAKLQFGRLAESRIISGSAPILCLWQLPGFNFSAFMIIDKLQVIGKHCLSVLRYIHHCSRRGQISRQFAFIAHHDDCATAPGSSYLLFKPLITIRLIVIDHHVTWHRMVGQGCTYESFWFVCAKPALCCYPSKVAFLADCFSNPHGLLLLSVDHHISCHSPINCGGSSAPISCNANRGARLNSVTVCVPE